MVSDLGLFQKTLFCILLYRIAHSVVDQATGTRMHMHVCACMQDLLPCMCACMLSSVRTSICDQVCYVLKGIMNITGSRDESFEK